MCRLTDRTPMPDHSNPNHKRGGPTERMLIAGIAILTILQAIATYFLIRSVLAG